MIYYIIPPIIIIASITFLIWFLFRKVSLIPEDVVRPTAETFYVTKTRAFFANIGHFFLAFAEALIRRAKLFSLKFHNASNGWVQAIRRKRENGRVAKKQRDIMLQAGTTAPKENSDNFSTPVDPIAIQEKETGKTVFERRRQLRSTQPMVSDSVTLPQKTAEKETSREKLEDVLIKRIAMNPRDIEAYERLGDYYMEQASAKDALECYRQVLKLSPAHHKVKVKIRRLERMLTQR